jgi:hypothetical protein
MRAAIIHSERRAFKSTQPPNVKTENDMATNNDVTTQPVASTEQHNSFFATWPYWTACAAVIGLLGLAFYFGERDGTQLASAPVSQANETVGMRTSLMTASEIRSELYSSLSAVRVALQSMNSPATARTYLPQLREAADRLDQVSAMMGQLSPLARQGMAASMAPTMRPLNQMFDRVLAMPEIGETAKPTIDALRSKLEALSRA